MRLCKPHRPIMSPFRTPPNMRNHTEHVCHTNPERTRSLHGLSCSGERKGRVQKKRRVCFFKNRIKKLPKVHQYHFLFLSSLLPISPWIYSTYSSSLTPSLLTSTSSRSCRIVIIAESIHQNRLSVTTTQEKSFDVRLKQCHQQATPKSQTHRNDPSIPNQDTRNSTILHKVQNFVSFCTLKAFLAGTPTSATLTASFP